MGFLGTQEGARALGGTSRRSWITTKLEQSQGRAKSSWSQRPSADLEAGLVLPLNQASRETEESGLKATAHRAQNRSHPGESWQKEEKTIPPEAQITWQWPAHHLGGAGGGEKAGGVYVFVDRNYYGEKVLKIIIGRRCGAQDQKDGKLENNQLNVASICKNESVPGGGNYRSISLIFTMARRMQASCCTWECN